MSVRDKILNIAGIIKKHFLMPFCFSIFIILITISSLGLKISSQNNSVILYAGLVFGFLAFFLWFRKLGEGNKVKKLIVEFCSPLFLISIFIITISNLNFLTKLDVHLIKQINPALILVSILSGFIIFYTHREEVERKIEQETKNEKNIELKRISEFEEKFKRLSWFNFEYKIISLFKSSNQLKGAAMILISPFIWFARLPYSFVKWMYKEGWWYSTGLILIILIGFVLRFKITTLDSFQSSWHILESAKGIISHGIPIMLSGVIYLRGVIYQYFIAICIFLFGFNTFSAAIPGILFSSMTIILTYIILKNISKPLAIIGSFFISLSGYLIAFGTYHNYSMAIFFLILSLYFAIQKRKIFYVFSSLLAINSSEVGAIILTFPFLISLVEATSIKEGMHNLKNHLFSYTFFIPLIFYFLNSYFLIGYIIPKGIEIINFNSFKLNSFFIFTNQIKFIYFLDFISSVLFPMLIFLIIFIPFIFTKKYKFGRLLLAISLLCFIAVSMIGGFKQQARIVFFIIPFILLLTAYVSYFLIMTITSRKKVTMAIIILFFLLMNANLLYFHITKNFGTKIPEIIRESDVFTEISNQNMQARFINQLPQNSLIITTNRWFEFYSNKPYLLITKKNWLNDQVYQYYDQNYRYLFTDAPVIYTGNDLNNHIYNSCKNGSKIFFADFFDFEPVIRELDSNNKIRTHLELVFHSQFKGDHSTVWRLDCQS